MRTISCLLIIYVLTSCNASKAPAENAWTLSWSDEFNYTGLPDSSKWDYDTGGHGWGNNELQYYTDSDIRNVEVNNGTLKLRALREKTGDKDYSSARMVTRGKADFTYGKIEINAKLPAGRGLWPALWMLGNNIETVDWPECGEIDIMEHVGYEKDSIFGTIHTKAYNHVIGTQKMKKIFIKDPYGSFHRYTLEWTPEHMKFFLDDTLFNEITNEKKSTAEWPFDSPFYLLMNIAVGGNLGGQHGVDSTVFPATMEVDYVRVYKQTKE